MGVCKATVCSLLITVIVEVQGQTQPTETRERGRKSNTGFPSSQDIVDWLRAGG